jgi:hypothetical protein
MSPAATKILRQGLTNFGAGRVLVSVKERFCGHDHSVDAIATLRRLLCNERLLKRMWLSDGPESFERDH